MDIANAVSSQRRIELAEESVRRRKEEAAKYLAHKNKELVDNRRTRGTGTDYALDGDAGFARIRMAEASEARRREKARRLAAASVQSRRTNANTGLRIDADISDETAGRRRMELAADSKRRRVTEARALANANAEMRRRLQSISARTDSKKGSKPTTPTTPAEVMAKHAAFQLVVRKQQKEDDDETELQLLREMMTRTSVGKRNTTNKDADGMKAWDSRIHRDVPYGMRGLRPLYTIEPWSQAVVETSRENDIPPYYASTSPLKRLDDGLNDDIVSMRRRRMAEDEEAAQAQNRPVWNNEIWHTFPQYLRGIKPVTHEPWLPDLEQYQERDAGSYLS